MPRLTMEMGLLADHSNATSHYPDGHLLAEHDQNPFRANSSLAVSNRTSLSSEYMDDRSFGGIEVRTSRTNDNQRPAWTTRVRIPTGAPF